MRFAIAVTLLALGAACAPPALTDPPDAGTPDAANPEEDTGNGGGGDDTGGGNDDADGGGGGGGGASFDEVHTILTSSCNGSTCHNQSAFGNFKLENGPDTTKEQLENALDGKTAARDETPLINAGKPESSRIYTAVNGTNTGGRRMPPPPKMELGDSKIETIRQWIADGASYD